MLRLGANILWGGELHYQLLRDQDRHSLSFCMWGPSEVALESWSQSRLLGIWLVSYLADHKVVKVEAQRRAMDWPFFKATGASFGTFHLRSLSIIVQGRLLAWNVLIVAS